AALQEKISILIQIKMLLEKVISLFIQKKELELPIEPIEEPEPIIEPPKNYIELWAKAIETMEGYGTPKAKTITENFNPGAIKGKDGKFLKFNSYSNGFAYLCGYLTRACKGEHPAYLKGGETTLLEFFEIYSPSKDGNYPRNYANFVGLKLKVGIDTKIKTFI
ncbi:MAG: hypothetical protein AAB877_00160, partial [Patescibacteria group bacterium]